jgi:hypothetical protein
MALKYDNPDAEVSAFCASNYDLTIPAADNMVDILITGSENDTLHFNPRWSFPRMIL